MTEQTKKRCPSCHQSDITDFSTCRFCHTRYDAVIKAAPESSIGKQLVAPIAIVLLVLGPIALIAHHAREVQTAKLAVIRDEIKSVGRPRVLEFYATWCGPCKAYEPTVLDCSRRYAGRVDFQRLDIDDPENKRYVAAMGVRAVPTTCIFNENGQEVYHQSGDLPQEWLDDAVKKVAR